MPVVSRIAKVRIADTATGTLFREWLGTATVQDTAAGAAVDIVVTQTTGGATPPALANTLTLNLYNDSGTLIRTYDLVVASTSQTVSFSFTADGTSTGAARAGTVEIAIRATRTTVATYDVESDGTPNTPGTGNTSTLDRGWIRGTTTSTTALSNIGLGVAKSNPAEYDESLFARTTLGADLYVARALTTAISGATPALSGATNSTATGNWDATFANVTDDRFPAAVTAAASSLTVPNATLTAQPDTVLTATNDTINVDPRLTAGHHFQIDDNTFALADAAPTKGMQTTETGFLATRFVSARTATGINGLTVTQTLTPVKPGTAVSASSATATRDSQAGWTDLLTWGSSKPGGTWNKTVDITAPADIDADTHVLGGNDIYFLLARQDFATRVNVNHDADKALRHFEAGMAFCVVCYLLDAKTQKRVDPALITSVKCSVTRANPADTNGLNNRYDFLNSDSVNDGTEWTTWVGDAAQTLFTLTASASDPRTYEKRFTNTTNWAGRDFRANVQMVSEGVTYTGELVVPNLGKFNNHEGYALDPVDFALNGSVSFK